MGLRVRRRLARVFDSGHPTWRREQKEVGEKVMGGATCESNVPVALEAGVREGVVVKTHHGDDPAGQRE